MPPKQTPVPPVAPPLTTSQPVALPLQVAPSAIGRRGSKKSKDQASTQNALLISEIRDGLVIMRDGSLRSVVMCQSINFDLMSGPEREAVEFSYQGFLNTLYFPIQVYIRTQRVDLSKYLEKLETSHANQENMLLGLLMEDYIAYVRYLLEAANVMAKQFYVVIPYFPPLNSQEGLSRGLKQFRNLFRPTSGPIVINEANYNRYKSELTQRVQVVLNSLNQMGVQAIPLDTQELIELYYTVYNPQIALNQQLTNVADLEAPMVRRGQGENPNAGSGGQS